MATNANELRAAAELVLALRDDHENEVDYAETRDRLFSGMTDDEAEQKAAAMICGMARHILATVPADDGEPVTVGDTITVGLLEHLGGVVYVNQGKCSVAATFDRPQQSPLLVTLEKGDAAWTVSVDEVYGITSAADIRNLLELLGCKLKGGAQ